MMKISIGSLLLLLWCNVTIDALQFVSPSSKATPSSCKKDYDRRTSLKLVIFVRSDISQGTLKRLGVGKQFSVCTGTAGPWGPPSWEVNQYTVGTPLMFY